MDSSSIIVDLFTTLECTLLTVLLFWFYYQQKITAIELILYGVACSTFFIPFISNTITPLFFITTYFFISEGTALFKNKLKFRLSLLIILALPFLSSIVVSVLITSGLDIFDGNNPSVGRIFYDGLFFYVKYFLPLVFLGTRVYREGKIHDPDYFFSIIKRIALISCYIGLFQLVISSLTSNDFVLRMIGLRHVFLSYSASGHDSDTARISAFFVEPKFLASFLVVSFPLFLKDKKIIPIILVLVVGLLTASQTFIVGILISVIIFLLIRRIKNIRLNIIMGLLIIVGAFYSISLLKVVFFNFYLEHSDNYVVNLVLSRAIDRYDVNKENPVSTDFLGIPLQKDSDLPIALFFATKPLLYLSGYGPKNGGFVSPKYYIYNDEGFKQVGSLTYNQDLRWFYFIAEFGVIIFFVWLCYFTTRFNPEIITGFENKYYAFLIVFLFFNGVELFIIMAYSLYMGRCYYKKDLNTQKLHGE